jgi:uncharacterized protein YciI
MYSRGDDIRWAPFAAVTTRMLYCGMEAMKSSKEQLAEGRQLERSGDPEAAAQIYRKLVGRDPRNQDAVNRLLVVYRKLKNYREELAVINQVLAAYQAEDKARQEKWVREHSKAAAAGAAIFQKLGGSTVSGFGADPAVGILMRRREVVERKVSGKKGVKKTRKSSVRPRQRRHAEQERKEAEKRRKQERARREEVAAERRLAVERKKEETAARKAEAAAKKAQQAEAKKTREEAVRKAAEERKQPSLFVVILQYRAPLAEIDAAMAEHLAFLNERYKKGDFLVSGRQEPRIGGIILARGKDREAIKRLMQTDPLIRKGLANLEVVEFKASRMDKGLARYFNRKK